MSTLARILALLALVSLAGCGGGSAAGTYKIDSAATQAANESMKATALAEVPDDMREMAEKMFTEMFAKMEVTIVLADDGTLTGNMMMPNPMTGEEKETMTGTWSADGDKVTMTTKTGSNGKEDTVVATLDGTKLTAKMSENGQDLSIILTKQ